MAVRIPTYQGGGGLDVPQAPQVPYRHESIPAIGAGKAQGEAFAARQLEGLGNAVSGVGADVQQIAAQKQAEADQAQFAKLQAQSAVDLLPIDAGVKQNAIAGSNPAGGAGLSAPAVTKPQSTADQTKAAYEAYRQGVLKTITSPHVRQAYNNWFEAVSAKAQMAAFDFDQSKQEAQKRVDLQTAIDLNNQLVSGDPNQFDAAWARTDAALSAAEPWMDPAQYAKARYDARHNLELTRAQTIAQNSPLAFQQEAIPRPANEGPENPQPASKGWVGDPRYSHLRADEVATLVTVANSAVVKQHTDAVKETEAARAAKRDVLMQSLLPGGDGNMTTIWKARSDGTLQTYEEINAAMEALKKRDKENMDTSLAWGEWQGGHQYSYASESDRKHIDLLFNAMAGADGVLSGDQQTIARVRELVNRSGIVPQTVVETLRGGMVSRDPNTLMQAYTAVDGLYRENPAAVANAFPAEDLRRMDVYERLAPIVPHEELLSRLDPTADPQQVAARQQAEKVGRELAAKVPLSTIISKLPGNGAGWFSGPEQPVDGAQTRALMMDFAEAKAVAYSMVPDDTKSTELALQWISREKWGPTEIGDTPRLMAYPPERYYDVVNGDHHWMDDQIETVAKKQFPDAQRWGVMTAPETEGNLKSAPPYYVWAIDKDGKLGFVTSPDWQGHPALVRFDRNAALEGARAHFSEMQGSLIPSGPGPVTSKFGSVVDGIQRSVEGKPVLRGNQFDPALQWKLMGGQ